MLFLAFDNNKNSVIDKKDLSSYAEYYCNIKTAFVLATDISCFIKFRGAIPLLTVEKMINIDLDSIGINGKLKKTIKLMILEILEEKYSVKPMELKCSELDDEEFIEAYRKMIYEDFKEEGIMGG